MIGTKLAHYQITSHLGSGGMGDVYQATDAKLGRSVAIKLLPEAFTHDGDRAARFEREARVLASLNHSNIAAIHGIEEADGRKFLVMELVAGETLAQRIERGPIPIDEALPIAKQIAEGLEAAHEKGISHRDLKPANIKITPQGQVKVLDFGLAKAFAGEASDMNLSNSPTMMSATIPGMILGTAAYMSPEQAKGMETDRTADIWAFGCVLYEMLTGHAAFEGETLAEILAGVMKAEPDWSRLPAGTPAAIQRMLRRALRKDPRQRLGDIRDARIEIEEALKEPEASGAAGAPVGKNRERFAWMVAVLLAIAATIAVSSYFRPSFEAPEAWLQLVTPDATLDFAISPDGRKLVYRTSVQLWVRTLNSETAEPLAGTENMGSSRPFWSPDSRSIGFFADGKLKRVDLESGAVQTITDAPSAQGGAWNSEGIILFDSTSVPLRRVSVAGGAPVDVTAIVAPQVSHRHPQFLPDGRHFLFFVNGTPSVRGVYVGELDSKVTRRLIEAETNAVFAPPDLALFIREDILFAQRLNLAKLEPAGDPFPVASPVARDNASFYTRAVVSAGDGAVAYRPAATATTQLVWFDRAGRQIGTVGDVERSSRNGPVGSFSLSPDGRMVAIQRTIRGNTDVWLVEISRGVLRRLTFDPAIDSLPSWSPDGTRIVFHSTRTGQNDLYEKSATGAEPETLLLTSSQNKDPFDWSSDGRFIAYVSISPETLRDLWVLPMEEDRKPVVFAETPFNEGAGARFSPDVRWLAYESNETGRNEIFVHAFPGPGGKWQVSTTGGARPKWRADGRELFYLAPGNRLMVVQLAYTGNGTAVEVGNPAPLFTVAALPGDYAVTPDGQRFLIGTSIEQTSNPPITVILNWKPKS